MRGAISPFPQYAFLMWCSVKKVGLIYTNRVIQNYQGKWPKHLEVMHEYLKILGTSNRNWKVILILLTKQTRRLIRDINDNDENSIQMIVRS
jgi:hypothetical protein